MNTSIRSLTLAFTLAAASLLGTSATAQAQTPTVINSLPYTITTKGLYVLGGDLSSSQTSGSLIQVNASNVTIDFQGHYIAGPVNNQMQTTVGVYAVERSNVTVKNGTVAYCYQGIVLQGNGQVDTNSVGHQIDNMRVTYCYYLGIYIVNGLSSRITNCQVSQIGAQFTNPYGIIAGGAGVTISNNSVTNVFGANAYGIKADAGSFIRQNTVSSASYGVFGGKYQDNLTANCGAPYSGGTDAGGNN